MSKRKASITSSAAPSALLGDIRALIEASRLDCRNCGQKQRDSASSVPEQARKSVAA